MGKNTAFYMLTNHNILICKYVGQTNYAPSKVKIISERFKQSITFSYNSALGNTEEQAELWLTKNGFNVIGIGEGKGHFYIITTTFKPLKGK